MTTGSKPMEFVKLVANVAQKMAATQILPSKEPGHYIGPTEFGPRPLLEIYLDSNDNPIPIIRKAPAPQAKTTPPTKNQGSNTPASNKIAATGQGQAAASQAAAAQVAPGIQVAATPGAVPGQVIFAAPGAPPVTGLAGGPTSPKTSVQSSAASPRTAVHPPVTPGQVIVAPPPGAAPGQVILAAPGAPPAAPQGSAQAVRTIIQLPLVRSAPPQGAGGPTPSGSAPSSGLGWKGALAAIALSALASHLFGRYMGTPSGEEFAETKRLIEALKAQLRSQQHMLETAPYHYANIHALANALAARQDMTEALANMLMQMTASRQQAPQTIFI
jgi:hypothetical protein